MHLLSLNGGGCCGYMTACLLSLIEQETKKSSYEIFDLVCGVSTGAIVAAGIGKGIPAKQIAELYKDLSKKIFKNKSILPWKSWYDSDRLDSVLRENLSFTYSKSKIKTMIYASKISGPGLMQSKFWKSWQEKDTADIVNIIVASCSAPVYFSPKTIDNDVFIDGGFVSNNPSICCISEALRLGNDIRYLKNLNFHCGENKGFDNASKLNSILKWIPNISKLTTLSMKIGERSTTYQAEQLIGINHCEVGPAVNLPLDSMDFDKMDQQVDFMWTNNKKIILKNLN